MQKISIVNYILIAYCIVIIVIIIVMPNFHREYVFLFILSGFIMFIYSIVIMALGGSCNEKRKIDYKNGIN